MICNLGIWIVQILQVVCGFLYVTVLSNCGHVFAWGLNKSYQCGLVAPRKINRPTKLTCSPEVVTDISACMETSCCITKSGRVYLWGPIDPAEETIYETPTLVRNDALNGLFAELDLGMAEPLYFESLAPLRQKMILQDPEFRAVMQLLYNDRPDADQILSNGKQIKAISKTEYQI